MPADVLAAHIELGHRREAYTDMDAEFVAATRSLLSLLRRRRQVLARLAGITCPVLLLHGEKDRLVPVAAARRVAAANPRWRFRVVPAVGHVPMLEDPAFTLAELDDWLPGVPGDQATLEIELPAAAG